MKKVLKIVSIFSILLIASGLGVGYYALQNKDKIINRVISEINKSLTTEISTQKVDLSLWEKFPSAAISFQNISAFESYSNKSIDTLIYLEKLYLELNVIELILEEYNISNISLENGFLNLKRFQNGKNNYSIFTSSNDSSTNIIDLTGLHARNVNLKFWDENSHVNLDFDLINFYFSGKIMQDEFDLALSGDLYSRSLVVGETNYLSNRETSLSTTIYINSNSELIDIKSGKLSIANTLNFELKGKFQKENYKIQLEGDNIVLRSLILVLPKYVKESLQDYDLNGDVNFNASVYGIEGKTSPKIDATYSIQDGTMKLKDKPYTIDHLAAKGTYSNGRLHNAVSSTISVDSLYAHLDDGFAFSKFKISNLSSPRLSGELKGESGMGYLIHLLQLENKYAGKGKIDLTTKFKGQLPNGLEISESELNAFSLNGKIRVSNANLILKEYNRSIDVNESEFVVFNKHMKINSLEGKLDSTNFSVDGYLKEVLPFILQKDKPFFAELNVNSNKLFVKDIINFSSIEEEEQAASLLYNIKLQLTANQVVYNSFKGEKVSTKLFFSNDKIIASKLNLNHAKGNIKGSVYLTKLTDGNYKLLTKGDLVQIDISEFFRQFKNFGQTTIKSENISGEGSGKFEFYCLLDDDFQVSPPSVNSRMKIKIDKGALADVESFKAISNYFRESKVLKLLFDADVLEKKFQKIEFASLQNEIEIENEQLIIPQMEIKSSAMDINLQGHHGFNDTVNYRFDFNMRDLLKKEGNVSDIDGVEEDEKGGRVVYMIMEGHIDNPAFSLDRIKRKEKTKEKVKEEKQEIKTILKDEFGLFEEVDNSEDTQEEIEFELEWDEFEESNESIDSLSTLTRKDSTKKKGFLKKIIGTEEESTEPEPDFEWDDDF